jgi:hypothetical protein
MKISKKEKLPMFRDIFGSGEIIWMDAGEEFEVIETKIMKHDNKKYYKVKSKWFNTPMQGFHNPDNFEQIEGEVIEEPKQTLYEKALESVCFVDSVIVIDLDDIKQALKEFLVYLKMDKDELIKLVCESDAINGDEFILNKAKEIFGEEMLK